MEPFVGRHRELARLDPVYAGLAEGRGHLVVVAGEAGIGKTRFCAEVAERARRAGARAVEVRCWLDGGAPPWWPWQSILAELCDDEASRLLGSGATAGDVGPDRFARFVAVTERLADACSQAPVCLVIDDVGGADAGALLLVRFLARSLPRFPLLLVLGWRTGEAPAGPGRQDEAPGEEARLLDEIEREATSIVLRGFDAAESREFLASHGFGETGEMEDDLVRAVHGLTGGHPLFLRRLVQAKAGPDAEAALHGGLRVAIGQALGALDPETRRLLSVGAVLGPAPLVGETAELAGCDSVAVLDAVDEAAAAGLVGPADGGCFAFSHELVRAALEDQLRAADRLEAHARAAELVARDDRGGPRAHRLARAAHHARCAAPRSAGDARRAVDLCEAAAQAMVRNYAYEQADTLFTAAVDLHSSSGLGKPPSLLALQWADAAALRGHMDKARERYGVAVARAEAEGRPALLAEAALGWGGVWLGEYATPVERSRMLALYRQALDRLPDAPAYEPLRQRLRIRLLGEDVFVGGPTEPLLETLEAIRRTGEPRALAEALSLTHHALFTPEHTRSRLTLADELVEVASRADLGTLSLMGLLWRTIDILHLGAEPCTRALELLRERATAVRNDHILYNVGIVDVLLLMGQGRFDDAEAEALRCHQLGERTGRVDRDVYLASQLAAMRWMQGREAELLDGIDAVTNSPTLSDDEFAVWAMAAVLLGRAGAHDRARRVLDRWLPAELAHLQPSGTWLTGLVGVIEAAAAVGHQDLAAQAYALALPYAELPTVVGLGVACLGSTERPLGVAASLAGRHDAAVAHLERAVVDNERLGNCPMATISRAELAGALAQRAGTAGGNPTDGKRAQLLLARAATEGTSMGLCGRVASWEAQLELLGQDERPAVRAVSPPVASAAPAAVPRSGAGTGGQASGHREHGVIRREGRRWVVGLGGRRIRVPHRLGMTYLAELLAHPGLRIPAVTLAAMGGEPGQHRPQDLLDDRARDAYAARARELASDVAEAESDNDLHRAERLRIELDALVDELESATGLGGRSRHFPDDVERARVAVQKAIKRAIEAIEDADPTIADLLRQTVATGTGCTYTPSPQTPVAWASSDPG
jgi:hypothetical protein